MFRLFLDPSMTYSSALYQGDPANADEATVDAQHRKIDRCSTAPVSGPAPGCSRSGPDGASWRSARRTARRVTSLTISTEQSSSPGCGSPTPGSAIASTCCCRTTGTTGRYDAVVSVEMIEAVGANHWPDYFRTVDCALVPGGRFGLQAILQDDANVRRVGETYTWIRKYIFRAASCPRRVDRAERAAAHVVADHRPAQLRPPLRRDAAPLAGSFRGPRGELARLGFDESSGACGRYTSLLRGGISHGYSTSTRSPWSSRPAHRPA